jgi:PAS domain S-box-containing protein
MKGLVQRLSPTTTTVGLGLIVLLLIGNAVLSEWNISRMVENEGRVVHTQEVLTTLEAVLAAVTEAEAAERGFLITGNPQYLGPYQEAADRSVRTLDRLTTLLDEGRGLEGEVAALRGRVDERLGELRHAISARKAGGFPAARQCVATNHSRELMNDIRRLVGGLKQAENESLAAWAAQSRRSARLTLLADWVDMGVGIGLVGLAFYLFRRDLALRRRADEATHRLAAIVESSDDAIIGESLDGLVVSWNAGAQRLYGYSAAEVINRPAALLCPPENAGEVHENVERVRRGVRLEHFETCRIHKDGRRIDVSLSISPIKDAAGRVVGASAIARDITERKTLQREVLEIAAREQRRIGQDLHDGIGQEMTGLAMLAQRLAGLLADRGLPEAAAAEKISAGLEHALRQMRALARGLVPVELDAEGLMFALKELARRTSELHGIACSFRCSEPVTIPDNQAATHLYRMSQEALTNAVKHGRARDVEIRLEARGRLVTLAITDDGVGFAEPPEEAAGTGVRIMRYRADLIGAKLAFEPVSPHGTRVACTLRNPG